MITPNIPNQYSLLLNNSTVQNYAIFHTACKINCVAYKKRQLLSATPGTV